MKLLVYTLAIGGAGYLALLAYLFLTQRSLIYLPSPDRPDLAAAGLEGVMEPVTVTSSEGHGLLCWYRAAPDPQAPTLVYLHGNGGHLGHRAHKVRAYLEAGFGVLLVGYRGYGGNPGLPNEEGLYADARAALDFAAQQGVAPERLVLYGESLGSAVAVQMATERPVAAVLLEAPIASLGASAQHHYPFLPARWLVLDRYDSLSKIGRVRAPVLVMHGERDVVTPVRFGRALFEAASQPKEARYFPQAGHVDLDDFGAADTAIDFVRRHVRGAATDGR